MEKQRKRSAPYVRAEAEVHCMQGMREEQKEKCTVCKA